MDLVNQGKVTSTSSATGHVHELNDITDISAGSPNLNDTIVYLDNKWVAAPLQVDTLADYNSATASLNLAQLTATNITGTIDSTSTIGGVSGSTLAVDRTAWTTYNPTVTGTSWATGATVPVGQWKQIGKTVYFKGSWSLATATIGSTSLVLSLPVTALDTNWSGTGRAQLTGTASTAALIISPNSTTTFIPQLLSITTTASPSIIYANRAGITSAIYTRNTSDLIVFSGIYEAA